LFGDVLWIVTERARNSPTPGTKIYYEDIPALSGFDDGVGTRNSDPNARDLDKDVFYRHEPAKQHVTTVVECSPRAIRPSCILHFSLRCEPALAVELGVIDYAQLPELGSIQRATEAYVTRLVASDECQGHS
jgi:hypothetical protein